MARNVVELFKYPRFLKYTRILRRNINTLEQVEVVNVVELKLACLSNLGSLSKLVSQGKNNNRE